MNQDQRELLELAAYAVGMNITWENSHPFPERLEDFKGLTNYFPWNPLTNKADAFDLMVKLGFSIHRHPLSIGISQYGKGYYLNWEELDLDEEVATMLAITRAAAAIGKQMKARNENAE